ncbi:hypothetical protein G6F50_016700 [Rhizopus delemar]|uniref:Uncharacterized protein n=1 Tax=Rhizopus delemar TaxID=936053 RepID=A0A9P7C1U4_9FUNG|nr:hypothetical protein G6F50_016700 [Rhizopus delemar]
MPASRAEQHAGFAQPIDDSLGQAGGTRRIPVGRDDVDAPVQALPAHCPQAIVALRQLVQRWRHDLAGALDVGWRIHARQLVQHCQADGRRHGVAPESIEIAALPAEDLCQARLHDQAADRMAPTSWRPSGQSRLALRRR